MLLLLVRRRVFCDAPSFTSPMTAGVCNAGVSMLNLQLDISWSCLASVSRARIWHKANERKKTVL